MFGLSDLILSVIAGPVEPALPLSSAVGAVGGVEFVVGTAAVWTGLECSASWRRLASSFAGCWCELPVPVKVGFDGTQPQGQLVQNLRDLARLVSVLAAQPVDDVLYRQAVVPVRQPHRGELLVIVPVTDRLHDGSHPGLFFVEGAIVAEHSEECCRHAIS